jgi:hypothetical protein
MEKSRIIIHKLGELEFEKSKEQHNIPRAIRAATVNISPIAKGRLDRIVRTLLGNLFTNPITPPTLPDFAGTFPFPVPPPPSSASGGAASDSTIFLDTFLSLLLTS